jgi:hypothetical protein
MNLLNIFQEIEKVDPSFNERISPRRAAIRNMAGFGTKVALSAIPLALGSLFQKAYGQTQPTDVKGVLNFALTLEYLESEFYTMAVAKGAALFPTAEGLQAFTIIRDHEVAHVNFLKTAITSIGATPVAKPNFDFSGGNGTGNGPFKDVFTNYDLLLAVAQVFEDTGVRAYKGQADKLMSNNDVLQAALQIHAVEARHASHIRLMRRNKPSAYVAGDVKPWITGKESGVASTAVQASYDGEENTNQAGVDIVNINNKSVSAAAASEAFDEPLTMEQVLAIATPFLAQ